MFLRFLFLMLLPAACLFGQATTSSITVTASRTPAVLPDQAVFAVNADSSLLTTLDDVVGALQGSGIGMSNFTGVSTIQQYGQTVGQTKQFLEWRFTVVTPLTSMKAETQALTALSQSLATANNGLTLSFSLQGLQVSPQLQQSQSCSLADLISDARAQANKIAGAASMTVGAILAVSNAVITTPPGGTSGSPNCTLTVKFATGAGF